MNSQTSIGWAQIILIYVLCVLGAATISQAVPVIGDIARVFHPSRQLAGYIISLPSIMVALGALLAGFAVDRIGDKPMLLVGSLVVIIGDVGVALSSTIDQLLVMRAVEGIGYVLIAVGTVTMVARTTDGKRRTSALTLWSTFVPMSFAVPLLLARQLAGTGQWRWAFLGHGIVLAVLSLMALWVLPRPSSTRLAIRTGGLGSVLRSPAVYMLGLAFAAAAFLQTGIVSTLPGQLAVRFGTPIGLAAGIATLGMVINMLGGLSTGPLLNRGLGSGVSIAVLGVTMATVGALGYLLLSASFVMTVAASLLFFLGAGIILGLWALLPTVAPAPQFIGATSGLVTQLTLWGVLFGPPAGFAAMASGTWTQMARNVVFSMAACLLLLFLGLRRRAVVTPAPSLQAGITPP